MKPIVVAGMNLPSGGIKSFELTPQAQLGFLKADLLQL
jgi:hypothetical protein